MCIWQDVVDRHEEARIAGPHVLQLCNMVSETTAGSEGDSNEWTLKYPIKHVLRHSPVAVSQWLVCVMSDLLLHSEENNSLRFKRRLLAVVTFSCGAEDMKDQTPCVFSWGFYDIRESLLSSLIQPIWERHHIPHPGLLRLLGKVCVSAIGSVGWQRSLYRTSFRMKNVVWLHDALLLYASLEELSWHLWIAALLRTTAPSAASMRGTFNECTAFNRLITTL
jgi:hypothetical protein